MHRVNHLRNIACALNLLLIFSFWQPLHAEEPRILMIIVPGGWDTTMVFDPQIGNSYVDQEAGTTTAEGKGEITYVDSPSRPSVKSFFDLYGDQSLIINGIYTNGITQDLTLENTLGTKHAASSKFTSYLSHYAYNIGQTPLPHLLIDLPAVSDVNQDIPVVLRSDLVSQIKTGGSLTPTSEPIAEAALNSFLLGAYNEQLNALTIGSESYRQVLSGYLNTARQSVLRQAIDSYWSQDSSLSLLTKKLLFAERVLANGLSTTVSIGADIDGQDWDSYTDSKSKQNSYFEALFTSLQLLMSAMADDSTQANTLLIITSNLGRAPQAENGRRAHWPYTSALLIGPGIKKAQTIGATDSQLIGKAINPLFGDFTSAEAEPLTLKHIFAAIFMKYEIPYEALIGKTQPFSFMLEQL